MPDTKFKVSRSKQEAVMGLERPTLKKMVRSLTGWAIYLTHHIANHKRILATLYKLTKKEPFVWTEEQEMAL